MQVHLPNLSKEELREVENLEAIIGLHERSVVARIDIGPQEALRLSGHSNWLLFGGQPDEEARLASLAQVNNVAKDYSGTVSARRVPPIAVVMAGGRIIVRDGHHRLLAAVKAGLAELPALVLASGNSQLVDP